MSLVLQLDVRANSLEKIIAHSLIRALFKCQLYSSYAFLLSNILLLQGGAFHRNAGHVLQAQINTGGMQGLAFQEYHPDFPHKQYTMGYAGA